MLGLRSAADVICHESTAGERCEGRKSLRQNHTLGISATATCSFLGTDTVLQTRKYIWTQKHRSVPTGRKDSWPKAVWPSQLVWHGPHTLSQAVVIWVCPYLRTDFCIKMTNTSCIRYRAVQRSLQSTWRKRTGKKQQAKGKKVRKDDLHSGTGKEGFDWTGITHILEIALKHRLETEL